jgi:uncharacterized protein
MTAVPLDVQAWRYWPRQVAVAASATPLILPHCLCANTLWLRLRGLLGRPSERARHGLLLIPCGGIHTLGMAYTIDVVYLGKKGHVLHLFEAVRPWRMPGPRWGTVAVLELAAGMAQQLGIAVDTQLTFYSSEQ